MTLFIKNINKIYNTCIYYIFFMKDILLAAKELLLAQWKEKEYKCHIGYVAQIAGELPDYYVVSSFNFFII